MEGDDDITVGAAGTGTSLIHVTDSGNATFDTLTIDGTDLGDKFLIRSNFIAMIHPPEDGQDETTATVERFNYDDGINGGITINGLEGNDIFAMDDNAGSVILNGGIGDDIFQFGQVIYLFIFSKQQLCLILFFFLDV